MEKYTNYHYVLLWTFKTSAYVFVYLFTSLFMRQIMDIYKYI